MEVKCFNPSCDGNRENLRYVAQEVQYFTVEALYPDEGWSEYGDLAESYNDTSFTPYITCDKCGRDFSLKGKEFRMSMWGERLPVGDSNGR